ncbi:hypothetical protein [Robinsoniella peoriensis]
MIGIKDMEMPKECWECELKCEICDGYTMCGATGRRLYPMGTRDTRPYECPLVEID